MKESSCKDCKKRHPNCHSECETYKNFREKLNEINLSKRKYAMLDRYSVESDMRIVKIKRLDR